MQLYSFDHFRPFLFCQNKTNWMQRNEKNYKRYTMRLEIDFYLKLLFAGMLSAISSKLCISEGENGSGKSNLVNLILVEELHLYCP